ncbi:ComF family protein [Streptomyces thinghirensis]|uniref:ComF family protein n=1 Tax=Streptomyces thinghirensis TaxID=551547 RepID=UPI0031EAEC17
MYQTFVRPKHAGWKTTDWVTWLTEQHIAPSVMANEEGTCALCRAPTPTDAHGVHYTRCFNCQKQYASVLDGFVPICYSVHDGLEGMLWRVKNSPGYEWLRAPLASLLWHFLERHLSCMERAYGGPFDVFTTVPSHSETRGGRNHLPLLLQSVTALNDLWTEGALTKKHSNKAGERRRKISTDLFSASEDVAGKRILLLDDTFTSGGTLASAAYALKQAQASTVVALAFGRQLHSDWDEHRYLIEQLPDRSLDLQECAVHGAGLPWSWISNRHG